MAYRNRATRSSIISAAAGAALVLSAAACPRTKAPTKVAIAKSSAIPDSADQVVFGSRTLLTNQGVANGVLLSDSMYVYDDGSRLKLYQVHTTFFSSQGEHDGIMTARSGVYNTRLSRLEATGDVVVTRADGMRLSSPQLVYDQQRNQIFTDSAFVLDEPDRKLTGLGFESDPALTRFRCLRACKGIAPVQLPRK